MIDQKHLHLSTAAIARELNFNKPMGQKEVIRRINKLFNDVTTALEIERCRFIGHIKALLDTSDVGQIYFSVTRFGQKPRRKGMLDGGLTNGYLTINVIVPDVSQETVEKITLEALKRRFPSDISS
jgi:hypothetical protein